MREIEAGKRTGCIKAISSKSHVHRLLICAALGDRKTVIRNVTFSKDVYATINCLNNFLADIIIKENDVYIEPYMHPCEDKILDVNESGSTYRFLIPIVCALGVKTSFVGAERLKERPLTPLYELLVEHGAILSKKEVFPLICKNGISSGEYKISGDVSSQFISGLIFALPLLHGDSVITVIGKIESYPYIKMTLDAVRKFGIIIEEKNNQFFIKGNQKYCSPTEICAEGDWSNAAFFACVGAVSNNGIRIKNLNPDSLQGDKEILNILSKMGADVSWQDDTVLIRKNVLNGVEIDASQIPDLVPVLATISSNAKGKTVIFNAQRLRLKESDRIESVYSMLKNIGAEIEKTDDGFIISGKEKLEGGTVNSENDHRIVMAASIASCFSKGSIFINGENAVTKSYPDFFKDFDSLEKENIL